MSGLSTHVLDTTTGMPGVAIKVTHSINGIVQASATTNSDGRVTDLLEGKSLASGSHTLTFEVAPYFAKENRETFYANINIDFIVTDTTRHYHVPLLLSPFSFSTYRGS
ncbi:unannotated protein [freshwater metagenome]|uniref:hydroxyisourate hydrolase n=1 Tax=freshwater metagenome TaxID=449393 RepID=A0A6J7BKK3_9ZZZZ|nr:hydroxyisourate hydrolase [Actinomycetota bacterium]MSY51675.1 hydroxyisourate hydrolase [Actinomycetota bacterium]MTA49991.1 hydroxyisourate hydrolase [Actinomycetota bacterium]